jgi:hypothetical protein
MWVDRTVSCTKNFQLLLTEQIFRGKELTTAKHITEQLAFFSKDLSPIFSTHKVNRNQFILSLTPYTNKSIKITEPFGTKYVDDSSFRIFSECNPFVLTSELLNNIPEKGTYRVMREGSITIENVSPYENIINVAFKSNVLNTKENQQNPQILSFYFPKPNTLEKPQGKDMTTIINLSQKVQHEVENKMKTILDKQTPPTYSVTYLQLRINEHLDSQKVDLRTIFESFETKKEVPFIKYVSNTQLPRFKLYRSSISSTTSNMRIPTDTLKSWTERKTKRTRGVPYQKQTSLNHIIFKVFYGNINDTSKYISVILYEDGHVDIKYSFGKHETTTVKEITTHFKKINEHLIKDIRDNVENLEPIDSKFWSKYDKDSQMIKIVALTLTYDIPTNTKKINITNMEMLASSLFPYFSSLPVPKTLNNKEVMHLQYKRISNFVKLDNIKFFLNRNANDMRNDKVTALTEIKNRFGLTEEEAEKAYDDWMNSQKVQLVQIGRGFYYKPANSDNISILIKPTTYNTRVVIDGITQIKYAQRIVSLITFLQEFSKSPERLSFIKDKTTIDVEEYDDAVHTEIKDDDQPTLRDLQDEELMSGDEETDDGDYEEDDELLGEYGINIAEEDMKNSEKSNTDDIKPDNENNKLQDKRHEQEEKEKVPIHTSIDMKDSQKYVIKMLQNADPKLFSDKYSSRCQWAQKRQPIVINHAEFERLKLDHPDLSKNHIKYGTTEEKKKRNVYICPQVWCPVSRTVMTKEQYDKKQSCPNPNEEPLLFYVNDTKYWDDGNKKGYVGFVTNTCLPCCFKKAPKPENMQKCIPPEKDEKIDNEPKTNPDNVAGPSHAPPPNVVTYIAVSSLIPIGPNKLATLPQEVSYIFKNTQQCKGAINDKMNCFIRQGQDITNGQSFLACIEKVLWNNKLKHAKHKKDTTNQKTFVQDFLDKLTRKQFILCQNGELASMFLDESRSINSTEEYKAFCKDFVAKENIDYVSFFKLSKVRDALMKDYTSFNEMKQHNQTSISKKILREYLIYNAFTNYKRYIFDVSTIKTHETLLHILVHDSKYNPKGYNIVILDYDAKTKNVFVDCPQWLKQTTDLTKPFVFILKHGTFYEPIYYIKARSTTDYNLILEHSYHGDVRIKDIIDFYAKNCQLIENDQYDSFSIYTYLNTNDNKVQYQVIDYEFRLVGFIVYVKTKTPENEIQKHLVFVPCHDKNPVILPKTTIIYTNEIVEVISETDKTIVEPLFKWLYDLTKQPCYQIHKTLPAPHALIMKDGTFVPLSKTLREQHDLYIENMNIFIGWEENDKRKVYVKDEETKNLLFSIIKKEVDTIIDKHRDELLKKEIEFLRDFDSTFPFWFKFEKMRSIIRKFVSRVASHGIITSDMEDLKKQNDKTCSGLVKENCNGFCHWNQEITRQGVKNAKCMVMLPEEWNDLFIDKLTYLFLAAKGKSNDNTDIVNKQYALRNNTKQIMFNQKDVDNGRLKKIEELIRNPYTFASKMLDQYIQEILDKDIVLKPRSLLGEILNEGNKAWENVSVLAKTEIFGMDKDFSIEMDATQWCVNVQSVYDPSYIFKLFNYIGSFIGFKGKFNERIFKEIVKNKIIQEFNKNDIGLFNMLRNMNPSFDGIYKKIFLKKPKLKKSDDTDEITRTHIKSPNQIFEIMNNENYKISEYELSVMAELFNVRVLLIRRKQGIREYAACIRTSKPSNKYIILRQKILDSSQYDVIPYDSYDIIVKNKNNPQVVFNIGDFPIVDTKMSEVCKVHFVSEPKNKS